MLFYGTKVECAWLGCSLFFSPQAIFLGLRIRQCVLSVRRRRYGSDMWRKKKSNDVCISLRKISSQSWTCHDNAQITCPALSGNDIRSILNSGIAFRQSSTSMFQLVASDSCSYCHYYLYSFLSLKLSSFSRMYVLMTKCITASRS